MRESERISKFLPLMQSLYGASKSKLGFKPDVKISIAKDSKNMENPLGKTAYYSPQEQKIVLFTQGRHIKDILRSLSHELVHHHQNCRGDFDGDHTTSEGYAQNDEHLREMEREAYECGNMIFRDWEDNLKSKGGKPLFTSTSQYVPGPTSSIMGVGKYIREGENKKMKLNESKLRDIIRGVIQEMFNDDLQEGDMISDPAASMEARAAEEEAEKAQIQPIDEEVEEVEEGVQATKGHFSKTKKNPKTDMAVDYEGDDKDLTEDSGDKEKKNYEKNVKDDEKHMKKLKKDMKYDKDHEKLEEEESFFPTNENIRNKARLELNEALTKKWAKIIK